MSKLFRFKPTGTFLAVGQDRHGSATKGKLVTGEAHFESQLGAKVIRGMEYMIDGKRVKSTDLRDYSPEEQARKVHIEGTGYELPVYQYFGNRKGSVHDFLQKAWYRALYRNKTALDLGSGLTTNIAAQAIANDWNWAAPSGAAINVLKLANFHATGTGTNAAAATDITLQTADAVTPVAGTQSLISVANSQKLQTVATLAYTGTEAVTEWGLHNSATLSTATSIGTPFTGSSSTGATVTGTPLTASSSTAQGHQQLVIVPGTTAVYGLVLSNSTSAYVISAWYKVADGTAGSTPGTTEAYTRKALLYDRKQFSAINVVNGDSIQFTYQNTIASGN